MNFSWLLALVLCASSFTGWALPLVQIRVQVAPATHSFTCHYRFTLPASDTTAVVTLLLNRAFTLSQVSSPGASWRRVAPGLYAGDTVHRVQVRFPAHARRPRWLALTYAGTLAKGDYTDQVTVFSGHTNWLPFRPYAEYELVDYTLRVQVPPPYQVRSSTPATRQRPGQWEFCGTTSHIEPTALIARQFYQAAAATPPPVALVKMGAPLARPDTALLGQARAILGFYNRTIGRLEPAQHFTVFLPGTNSGAYGLLNDATVITYTTFDVADRGDLMILAHEISHKWWAYGSFHTEHGWLSEAFATYSSLLYLQASGDEAGYQAELARLAGTVPGTPPLWGFDRYQHPFPMYRRVIYNKGTLILAGLRERVGEEKFLTILARTAAQHTSTTPGFLLTVEQVAGAEASTWLLAELKR